MGWLRHIPLAVRGPAALATLLVVFSLMLAPTDAGVRPELLVLFPVALVICPEIVSAYQHLIDMLTAPIRMLFRGLESGTRWGATAEPRGAVPFFLLVAMLSGAGAALSWTVSREVSLVLAILSAANVGAAMERALGRDLKLNDPDPEFLNPRISTWLAILVIACVILIPILVVTIRKWL